MWPTLLLSEHQCTVLCVIQSTWAAPVQERLSLYSPSFDVIEESRLWFHWERQQCHLHQKQIKRDNWIYNKTTREKYDATWCNSVMLEIVLIQLVSDEAVNDAGEASDPLGSDVLKLISWYRAIRRLWHIHQSKHDAHIRLSLLCYKFLLSYSLPWSLSTHTPFLLHTYTCKQMFSVAWHLV